ncbi:MAG: hypothetical protein M3Q07_10615 [Pseudobdellovibrionaceae bacterium]|nr:hypothetical protein [Pseudobdellovibrionaceae bacterium]
MGFQEAVRLILELEGGGRLVSHPDDPGGLTKYGISLRSHPELGAEGKIRPVIMSKSGKVDKVSVGFDARALWCKTGDLDTLKAIAPGLNKQAFQLTLESHGGDETAQAVRLSLNDITSERSYDFNLPPVEGNQILSVSLCLASGGQSCQEHDAWDPQEPLSRLENRNLLFYSQFLLRASDGIYLISSERWDENSVAGIKKALKGLDRESLLALTNGFSKIRTIKPMPAILSARGLLLPLSYNDPRCLTHQPQSNKASKPEK